MELYLIIALIVLFFLAKRWYGKLGSCEQELEAEKVKNSDLQSKIEAFAKEKQTLNTTTVVPGIQDFVL